MDCFPEVALVGLFFNPLENIPFGKVALITNPDPHPPNLPKLGLWPVPRKNLGKGLQNPKFSSLLFLRKCTENGFSKFWEGGWGSERGGRLRVGQKKNQELSGDPNPQYFLKSIAVQNGRYIAVQM